MRKAKKAGVVTLAALLILALIWIAGVRETVEILKKANPSLFMLAIFVFIVTIILWALRWDVFLRGIGVNANFRDVLRGILIGMFVNNVTPGARGGGEPVRMYFIAKRSEGDYGPIFATIMADRLLDLIPVFTMLILSSWYAYSIGARRMTWILLILTFLLFLLLLIGLLVMLNRKRMEKIINRGLTFAVKISPRRMKKWEEKIRDMIENGIPQFQITVRMILKRKRDFATALLLSYVFWALVILRSYLVFLSINYGIDIEKVMVVQMATIVISLVSIIPGGAGITETINSGLYLALGIDKSIAITATLLERLISYWGPTVVGGVLTTHFGIGVKSKR
ncbi:lysylphosphatidylglycerol synthase transmembrane domain-containing protein [Thermococcus sp.]